MNNFVNVTFIIISLFIAGCFSQTENSTPQTTQPVDYVNPYIGNISHLLEPTHPTVHLPNSMLRLIPNRPDYTTDKMHGLPLITASHRGSDAFSISPVSGNQLNLQAVYDYTYDNEVLTPYSWDVFLDNADIDISYSVSHQAGIYFISFDDKHPKYLMINNMDGEIESNNGDVSGYQIITNSITGDSAKVYLHLETEEKPIKWGILNDGKISENTKDIGKNKCIALEYDKNINQIKVRYGVSFISVQQAKSNLYREISAYDKEKLAEYGRKLWNEALNKTRVEGGSKDDKTVFYTSIYRTYERPVCISEDGKYYSGFDGKIHDDNGVPFYTDDWIWDTYRATHPLRCLTEKELELNVIRSFIRMAAQMDEFWMPTFPEVTGDSRRMNSNHGVAVVLDAYTKGLTDFDLNKAYKACKKAITEKTLAPWRAFKANELDQFYKDNGYFPSLKHNEEETVEGVNHRKPVPVTLGTTYDEWCLSQIAKILGKDEEAEYFLKRSYNYRKLYNAETGFFHPKDSEGKFIMPFDYKFSGGQGARKFYNENNGWIYRWDVPHNIPDLVELMGGNEQFVANLDATFNEPMGKSKFEFYAQLPDHTGNVGQFSMANEPSFHIPYLYNYAGQPWKTQKRIRKLLDDWFRNDIMGLPGDEDGGGMSAFIAFSQIGFYPVTPGSGTYTIGSPLFEKTMIDVGSGKTFTIIAQNASKKNKYIQSATLNGEKLNKPFFDHSHIHNGGELILEMGAKANKKWGVN